MTCIRAALWSLRSNTGASCITEITVANRVSWLISKSFRAIFPPY
jgi:hypothetical protein